MKADFWHDKWSTNRIGWHLDEVNPILSKNINALQLKESSRIFVPLCGKTLDIAWLLSQGYSVVGIELSQKAIQELFQELHVEPNISTSNELTLYSADNLEIYVGDFFKLDAKTLGSIDAVYDRAALVAMPKDKRPLYSKHIISITQSSPQLLVNVVYDENLMSGPPFCVQDDEVRSYYESTHALKLLESLHVDKLAGKCEAEENVWLLN